MTTEVEHQVIEIKLADHEQVRSLIHGVAHSVSLLSRLSEEERAALSQTARAGIEALFAACEGAGVVPPRNLKCYGSIIIEWPARRGSDYAMAAWKVSVFDAVTGEAITTASDVRIVDADVRDVVMADLTMFADLEGNPVLGGSKVWPDENGKIKTGVFRFLVAEMRIRDGRAECPGCGSRHPEGYACLVT